MITSTVTETRVEGGTIITNKARNPFLRGCEKGRKTGRSATKAQTNNTVLLNKKVVRVNPTKTEKQTQTYYHTNM